MLAEVKIFILFEWLKLTLGQIVRKKLGGCRKVCNSDRRVKSFHPLYGRVIIDSSILPFSSTTLNARILGGTVPFYCNLTLFTSLLIKIILVEDSCQCLVLYKIAGQINPILSSIQVFPMPYLDYYTV